MVFELEPTAFRLAPKAIVHSSIGLESHSEHVRLVVVMRTGTQWAELQLNLVGTSLGREVHLELIQKRGYLVRLERVMLRLSQLTAFFALGAPILTTHIIILKLLPHRFIF